LTTYFKIVYAVVCRRKIKLKGWMAAAQVRFGKSEEPLGQRDSQVAVGTAYFQRGRGLFQVSFKLTGKALYSLLIYHYILWLDFRYRKRVILYVANK